MKSTIATLFASFVFLGANHAATLVNWNLNSVTGPTENNSAFLGIESSTATIGANLTATNLITGFSSGHAGLVWGSGNAGPGKLNLQRWDHPADSPSQFGNGNGTPNNWLQFKLTADEGYEFTLTSVQLAAWRNGAGAASAWTIQFLDGENWVNFGSTHNETNAGDGIFRNVTFTDSITATELEFRFIATGPTGGTGNIHINKLEFEGTVAFIPEPATALLGGFGLIALLRRRR